MDSSYSAERAAEGTTAFRPDRPATTGWRPGLTVRFLDIVENGWASEGNPTRRGYFVRAFTRTGRMNPGLHWQITDGKGKFWEFNPREIGERLTVTPGSFSPLRPPSDTPSEQ